MARVKRAVAGRKKRQTLVARTKGYYGTSSRTFRGMNTAIVATRSATFVVSGFSVSTLQLVLTT